MDILVITERRISALKAHPAEAHLVGDPADTDVAELCHQIQQSRASKPIPIGSDATMFCDSAWRRAYQKFGMETVLVVLRADWAADRSIGEYELIRDIEAVRSKLQPLDLVACSVTLEQLARALPIDARRGCPQLLLRERMLARLGGSHRNLNRYFSVLRTPIEVQRAFRAGELTLVMAGKVAGLRVEDQQGITREIAAGNRPTKAIVEEIVNERLGLGVVATRKYKSLLKALESSLDLDWTRIKRSAASRRNKDIIRRAIKLFPRLLQWEQTNAPRGLNRSERDGLRQLLQSGNGRDTVSQ